MESGEGEKASNAYSFMFMNIPILGQAKHTVNAYRTCIRIRKWSTEIVPLRAADEFEIIICTRRTDDPSREKFGPTYYPTLLSKLRGK